jgi:pyruvate,water dikinase
LGADRDSVSLASLLDQRDEVATRAISTAIRSAHDVGIEIGICGQAPSDYPKFTQVLVGKPT